MNLKKLTIGKRIAYSFSIVLALLTLVGILSYSGVAGIVRNADQVIDGNKLSAMLAQKEVDHLNWSGKVNLLLTDKNVTELSVQTDDHKCGFGQWLYGEARRHAEALVPTIAPLLKEIEKPHARLHASAIEIKKSFSQADEHLPRFLAEKEIDHLKWKSKVEGLFLENLPRLEVTTDDHNCALGKFLYGESGRKVAASDPELARLLEEIKEPHKKLHASAVAIQKSWKQAHPGLINTLNNRLDDHRRWTAAVAISLLTRKEMNVQTDPKKCAFGKWLHSSDCKEISAKWPDFAALIEEVLEHHDRLHATAIAIADKVDYEDKIRIFEQETSVELDAVAGYFAKLISLEKRNIKAGKDAGHIFHTQTQPALEATQVVLADLKKRSVSMLDGMNAARHTYATSTIPSLKQVQVLLGKIRTEAGRNIMTDEVMLSSAEETKRNVTIASSIAMVAGVLLAFFIARGITSVLRRVAGQLGEGAGQVASASDQVSSSSQSLAEGASEQAASIEETSASLEEVAAMTRQNADNASQADNLMQEANRVVSKANTSMTDLTVSMEEISKASEETSKIIKTIDEIAFQTNLLALNAAVEAARAGEAGAGFAVVADEVRNLAMRAADAAKDTAGLIESTVIKVKDGSELVSGTNDAFKQVAASAVKVGELVGEIAAASNEQSQGIDQVNQAVMQMDKVVQQNAASAEESASAAEELNAQAEEMKYSTEGLLALVVGTSGDKAKAGRDRCGASAIAAINNSISPPKTPAREATAHHAKGVIPAQPVPAAEDDFRDF